MLEFVNFAFMVEVLVIWGSLTQSAIPLVLIWSSLWEVTNSEPCLPLPVLEQNSSTELSSGPFASTDWMALFEFVEDIYSTDFGWRDTWSDNIVYWMNWFLLNSHDFSSFWEDAALTQYLQCWFEESLASLSAKATAGWSGKCKQTVQVGRWSWSECIHYGSLCFRVIQLLDFGPFPTISQKLDEVVSIWNRRMKSCSYHLFTVLMNCIDLLVQMDFSSALHWWVSSGRAIFLKAVPVF